MPFDNKFVIVETEEERAEVTYIVTLKESLKLPKDATRGQLEALRKTKLSDMKHRIVDIVKKELGLEVKPIGSKQ